MTSTPTPPGYLYTQIQKIKSSIKQESKRYERLTQQLSLTTHQLDIYKEESKTLYSKIESSISLISKTEIYELRGLKAPVASILEICDKVLLVLSFKDRSWKSFRALSKNFSLFKDLLKSVQSSQVPESVINEVLPLWKNQSEIRSKLIKINLGSCLLLDWLVYLAEYSVKSEIINSSQKRIPELEKKIRSQSMTLTSLTNESISIEELIKNNPDIEDEVSLTDKPFDRLKDENIFANAVHRGTASGGIMQKTISAFPNFESEFLYREVPTGNDEVLVIETKSEKIGCCRLKFLCF